MPSTRCSTWDGRQSRCRDGFRAWYQLNNAKHKKNVAARNRRVRGEHARRLAEYLLEHSCVDCGEDDVRVLDFDHEDPSLKEWNIGRLTGMAMPWSRVEAEIAKCSVRCANCHRRRTAEMAGWVRHRVELQRRADRATQAAERLTALQLAR
jgi:hypothetical protein